MESDCKVEEIPHALSYNMVVTQMAKDEVNILLLESDPKKTAQMFCIAVSIQIKKQHI